MTGKHRILFIIDSLGPGGTQRQLYYLVKEIDKRAFSVSVYNLGAEKDFYVEPIRRESVTLVTIPQRGKFDARCFFKLLRCIREESPHVVETLLFTADCYGRITAKLANVPVILSSQRSVDLGSELRYLSVDKLLAGITSGFIANSEAAKSFLVKRVGVRSDKICVIHNGVTPDVVACEEDRCGIRKSLRIDAEDRVIGMIARYKFPKDHVTFLKMARIVLAKREKTHFILLGFGHLRPKIEEMAKQWQLSDKISFLECTREVCRIYSIIDIAVLSTLNESCSNVILESMAAGKPVIATNVGGNAELVEDGITGFLVDPEDADAMADKVAYLADNAHIAISMGAAGKKRIESRFSVAEMVVRTERCIRDYIKTAGL